MRTPMFNELKDLAEHDPEGFESLRTELIEDCIRSSSKRSQRRLQGLQFVIEAQRRVAGTPIRALLDIQAMMHSSVLSLHQTLVIQPRPSESSAVTSAEVLPFRRPRRSVD